MRYFIIIAIMLTAGCTTPAQRDDNTVRVAYGPDRLAAVTAPAEPRQYGPDGL